MIKKLALAASLAAMTLPALAAPISLTPAGQSFADCGGCTTFESRGVYFTANENFSISQIGWVGELIAGNFVVTISAGNGVAAPLGTTLASFSQAGTANGYVTNWFAASFNFLAGQEYHINLAHDDGSVFSTRYDFMEFDMSSSNIGKVTVMDGTSYANGGIGGGASNFWLSHFVLDDATRNAIPEPASLALVGLGLLGAAAARRRSRR